jgi:hypothetical protein
MSSWTFYFTALPLGLAVVILALAGARALTHDQGSILGITVAVASGVGYTIGRMENRN